MATQFLLSKRENAMFSQFPMQSSHSNDRDVQNYNKFRQNNVFAMDIKCYGICNWPGKIFHAVPVQYLLKLFQFWNLISDCTDLSAKLGANGYMYGKYIFIIFFLKQCPQYLAMRCSVNWSYLLLVAIAVFSPQNIFHE